MRYTFDESGSVCGYSTSTDGTWTYTWKHGRELATMSDGTSTWTYTYDANRMRTKRTNGTTTYTYVYNGGQLTQMTVGTDVLTFTYDANGNPFTFTYNSDLYYYVTNVQGDVVMLINSAGIALASYSYDAWGNLTTIDASGDSALSIATINPLRYRGYVYDSETELYYLQSRYYNPEIGRFLSADVVFDYDAGLQGFNLFAYCGNNPINRIDISGADSVSMDDATEDILEAKTLEGGSSAMGRSFSNAYNPMDAGYRYGVDLSQAANSSSYNGGLLGNGYIAYSSTQNPNDSAISSQSKHYNDNQRALLELVSERRKGLSMEEAQIINEWGKEYGFNNTRIDMGHDRGSNDVTRGPHLHIGPYRHVMIYL